MQHFHEYQRRIDSPIKHLRDFVVNLLTSCRKVEVSERRSPCPPGVDNIKASILPLMGEVFDFQTSTCIDGGWKLRYAAVDPFALLLRRLGRPEGLHPKRLKFWYIASLLSRLAGTIKLIAVDLAKPPLIRVITAIVPINVSWYNSPGLRNIYICELHDAPACLIDQTREMQNDRHSTVLKVVS
ncbi:hypothetical protein G7Y89_g7948 [Cudoniella acicularis]|uniref:Uncharacterized protein n=1 Tax=Cudoniella acicularis TaxID=354080 RepID=A0A8H4W1H6_9HELO|nr:hypothetical protein G7Y89_g7948 [Cudoniella acicularis]